MNPIQPIGISIVLAALVFGSGCARTAGVRRGIWHRESRNLSIFRPSRLRASARSDLSCAPERSRRRVDTLERGIWPEVGRSAQDRPIRTARFGFGSYRVMLIGSIHGNEPEGIPLVDRLAGELASRTAYAPRTTVLIVRNLNPDGTVARTRTNANGVDLNRNFPASNWEPHARSPQNNPGTRPASEPETQALLRLLDEFQPHRIVVLHSTRGEPLVNYDGPARELAEAMSRLGQYPVRDTIGYPTPGSLGNYAGNDLEIPIITLELPRGITADSAWEQNRDSLLYAVQ